MLQLVLIVVWFEAANAKSQEHKLQAEGVDKGSGDVVSHSCIHDQILEQRRRPGRQVYSVTPQVYEESGISKPLHGRGRALLSVSKFPEGQEAVMEPIRIYLNYDAVGHSPDRDCRNVGDIVKVWYQDSKPANMLWHCKGFSVFRVSSFFIYLIFLLPARRASHKKFCHFSFWNSFLQSS